jgi:cell division protein FtsL
MNEEKIKKRIVALTIGAVMLIVILISVLVYQFISIGVEINKRNELDEAIAEYLVLKDNADKELEAYSSYWWIVQRARELGYSFDGEHLYK